MILSHNKFEQIQPLVTLQAVQNVARHVGDSALLSALTLRQPVSVNEGREEDGQRIIEFHIKSTTFEGSSRGK